MKFDDLPEDVAAIVKAVAEETGIGVHEIMDRSSGNRTNAYLRFECMARIREVLADPAPPPPRHRKYTLVETGRFFDADHTSVIHAIKRRTEANAEVQAVIAAMHTPREAMLAERRMKSAVARLKMAQRRRALQPANTNTPVKVRPKTNDDRHVEACLAAGGFCYFSEVQIGTSPGGGRLMQITLPMVWPVADQIAA